MAAIHLTTEQQQYLESLGSISMREASFDFFVNRSGRYDCWMKTASGHATENDLSNRHPQERAESSTIFLPRSMEIGGDVSVQGALGPFHLEAELAEGIMSFVDQPGGASFEELQAALSGRYREDHIEQALWILVHEGKIIEGLATVSTRSLEHCRKLNAHLLQSTSDKTQDTAFVVSPKRGGPMRISGTDKKLLSCLLRGYTSRADIVRLLGQGESQGEYLLEAEVKMWFETRLPYFVSQGVVVVDED